MNTRGMSRAVILAALYNKSTFTSPVARMFGQTSDAEMTVEEAEGIIQKMKESPHFKDRLYFDYLKGRVMKVDINEEILDLRLYDCDNGPGAGEAAVKDTAAYRSSY